jgi:hypothetical protein
MADGLSICWIETIVTRKLLRHCGLPIRPMRLGPWQECYRLGGANQGAGQLANDQSRGLWGRFFVLSILNREHVARILDQSMLKPSSGTDEGPALFARELDRLQCALHAFVRTGWRTPQGVKLLQHGLTACMIQGRSGQPRRAHPHCESVGSMAEGFVGREMISQLGIKVTNDPNSQ